MALTTILSVAVRPEKRSTYEARVHELAEKAIANREPVEWMAHQVEAGTLGTFHFVSESPDWTALNARGSIEGIIRRVMGGTEGVQLLERLGECVLSQRYIVGQARGDLSYPLEANRPMRPMGLVTLFRSQPGGQDALEELIRKVAQAIPQANDPRRFMAYQTVIGDLRSYLVVTLLEDMSELDRLLPPAELLQKAFGAEGALIYRNGLDAVERMERQLTVLRPELSNGAWVAAFMSRAAERRAALEQSAH
jgi:hypothetical protein